MSSAGYLPPHFEIFGCNLFLKRAILPKIGGFNPALGMNGRKLAYGEESELHVCLCTLLPEHRAYFEPKLYVHHLVRPEKLSLWWQLHSTFMHGRAGYAITSQRQNPLTWWRSFLFPFSVFAHFGFTLLYSWLWRDRARYPCWQNYLYEAQHLQERVHRLGGWSVDLQGWIHQVMRKRGQHIA